MKRRDITAYWQAYPDLTELWAKGVWDEAALAQHFEEFGKAEGRLIPDESHQPQNWSDWLYFANQQNDFEWWWRKGITDSGLYSALLGGPERLDQGTIDTNQALQQASSLSAKALAQVAQNARHFPGDGPLPDIQSQKLQWAPPKAIGILPMRAAIKAALPEEYGYVILLPWLESGGAELVGLWHYIAAKELGLNPLIILADKPNVTARFAAQGLTTLNLPALFESTMGRPFTELSHEDRMEVLASAIELLTPHRMHLIHSYNGYTALAQPDTGKRLRAACGKIYVSAFCPHIHPRGNYDGYFRFIPDIMNVVDTFIFDNSWYQNEMKLTYRLGQEQSVALKYPVDDFERKRKSKKPRPYVLWASRFDSQKNPQIVGEIAAKMPDVEFIMYGRRVMGDVEIDWSKMPENVTDKGEFFNIDEMPLAACYAFLYTSKFDGTPNILLEMASRGLPIVTPNIGGISDFLGPDWPLYVNDPEDIEGYVRHLTELKKDTAYAHKHVTTQIELLKSQRSLAKFLERVSQVIDFK